MNWRKSSYSGQSGGNCIEVAGDDSRVLVRDTKDRVGIVLRFTPDAWRKFADKVKRSLAPNSAGIRRGALLVLAERSLSAEMGWSPF